MRGARIQSLGSSHPGVDRRANLARPPPKPTLSLGLDGKASPGPALLSPAPRSRQAGLDWSLLGLYKACKLTLCGEPAEGAHRGFGREGEGWGGRRLERVLAIPGPVEAAGSQGGTPGR